jgi:hypothetical protein
VDAFLAAVRSQDTAAVQRLLAPEATVERIADGVPVGRGRYGEVLPGEAARLQGEAARLVNFHQPAGDRAVVETYLVTYPEKMTQVTHLRWELARRGDMWQILGLREVSWTKPDHTIVYGTGP